MAANSNAKLDSDKNPGLSISLRPKALSPDAENELGKVLPMQQLLLL